MKHNKVSSSGGSGGKLTTPPDQTGDRAVRAGTKSINNREPSRQDWQPRGATDQLRQERGEKETEIYKARLQSQPQGPKAGPARPQTHEPTCMHSDTCTYTEQLKYMGH